MDEAGYQGIRIATHERAATVNWTRGLLLLGGGALLGAAATLGGLHWREYREHAAPGAQAAGREAMVHAMGGEVMPFSLEKTVHVFEMTTSGGVQEVRVRDPADSAQVPLIRQHLRHEAMRFQAGDYADPSTLHGRDMPGLKELAAGHERVRIAYADVAGGGRITFETPDVALLTAVHRWFGAQLSDHGRDATYR